MRKGLPSNAALSAGFGKRAKLALQYRSYREGERVTQAEVHREVAALTGSALSDATVSRWFGGAFLPSEPQLALALARALRVDPGWLYFGEHSAAPGVPVEPMSKR